MTTQNAIAIAEIFEDFALDHEPNGWPAVQQQHLSAAAVELRGLADALEKEREARMAAQVEGERLKDKVARSGVEHRRKVAVLANALRHIEGVALADEPRELPGIAQTAREALNHWGSKEEPA